MSRLKTIKVEVPEGAEAGDSLTFSAEGKEIEFPIPDGSKPGDVLQIQIQVEGGEDDDDNDDDNGGDSGQSSLHDAVTKVELHSSIGASLAIHNSIPGVPSPNDDENEKKDGSDGTSSMAWPAGLHLATFISSPQFDEHIDIGPSTKTIVELGSGSGLCGLAFAVTASSKLSKRKTDAKKLNIVLTDVPKAMDLLKFNIKANADQLSSHLDEDNLRARPLTWGSEEDASALDLTNVDVDLILGSDLLYNVSTKTFKDLSCSIQALDSNEKTKIILSVRWRKPEEERKFFQAMEHLGYEFNLLLIEDDADNLYRCNLGWRDFGNPNSDKSNDFFTDSYVQVDGESKPLKDISEDDMDVMTDGEFNAFEKRFIQIFVGQKKTS
jgi:predicted nicotinamide N-methyase